MPRIKEVDELNVYEKTVGTWHEPADYGSTWFYVVNPFRDWTSDDAKHLYYSVLVGSSEVHRERPLDYTLNTSYLSPRRFLPQVSSAKLKYSISYGTPFNYEGAEKLMELLAMANPKLYRKPKKPKYFPLKFYGKPPVLRLLVETRIPYPTQGKNISNKRWAKLYPRYVARRAALIEKINAQRRKQYERKLKLYEDRYSNFIKRRKEHQLLHEKRMKRYSEALLRYEARLLRNAKKYFRARLAPPQQYSEWNPYINLHLVYLGGDQDLFLKTRTGASYFEAGATCDNPKGWIATWFDRVSFSSLSSTEIDQCSRNARTTLLSGVRTAGREFDDLLARKLYDKIADSKVHIGNLIAERKQTFDLIAELYLKVKDLFLSRKKFLKSVVRSSLDIKDVSSSILKFKFGLEPLVDDIATAVEYLNSDAPQPIVTSRAGVSRMVENLKLGDEITFTGHFGTRIVSQYTMERDFDRLQGQFGLADLRQTLYEVTPWSFVVDWVIPIGSWIAAQSATRGLTFKRASRSYRLSGSFTFTPRQNASRLFDGPAIAGQWQGTLKFRDILFKETDLPSPDSILSFKSPWSSSHFFESVALALQRLRT